MLIKRDPIARTKTVLHTNDVGEIDAIESKQDVEDLRVANHEFRRHWRGAKSPHGEWGSFVGRIPQVLFWELVRSGRALDNKDLLKWLHEPENRDWKLHPGRFV